jgi:DNA-binding MarR family transcriptional regulator
MFQLNDTARAMRTYVDQCARAHGMTRAQWGALLRLERQEGMMQAELAESLEVQPISLARLIDRLCDQKLVERRPHPHDRRAYRLYLTAKGRATLQRFEPLGRRVSGDVLATFSTAEINALLNQLLRIKSNIRRSTAGSEAGARKANGVRHAG